MIPKSLPSDLIRGWIRFSARIVLKHEMRDACQAAATPGCCARENKMGFVQNIKDDGIFMRGAMRALRMTTPIAKNRTRVFPIVIEELAEKFGDAPALISERE